MEVESDDDAELPIERRRTARVVSRIRDRIREQKGNAREREKERKKKKGNLLLLLLLLLLGVESVSRTCDDPWRLSPFAFLRRLAVSISIPLSLSLPLSPFPLRPTERE